MLGIDFDALPLAWNVVLFAIGAACVWVAGNRLARYADALAEATGVGRAFLGLVLLAGVTELPEVVTSLSAVLVDNVPLAVNNLFGGIVMQTAILAIADFAIGRGSLTFFTPKPELLLQGVLLTMLLALVLVGVVTGDALALGGVGAFSTLVFVLYLVAIRIVSRFREDEHWRPVDLPDALAASLAPPGRTEDPVPRLTLSRIRTGLVVVSLVVLVAGTLLVAAGEAIAHQTRLGSSFVGATLLASTTSLPELSTTLGAVRLRAYSMAFANIFGSNAIMVALLFLADVAHRPGPILREVDSPAAFSAAMGIVVTGVYLAGLIVRNHRSVLRLGVDSLVVLLTYALTVVGLYFLR